MFKKWLSSIIINWPVFQCPQAEFIPAAGNRNKLYENNLKKDAFMVSLKDILKILFV